MNYLYFYLVASYVTWYVLMIHNHPNPTIGKTLFWFAPILLPFYLVERFGIRKL